MKERPILFKAHEVNGVLEGRQTQVRRVVKPNAYQARFIDRGIFKSDWHPYDFVAPTDNPKEYCKFDCPYGKVRDKLYVRERFSLGSDSAGTPIMATYPRPGYIIGDIDDDFRMHPDAPEGSDNWCLEWKVRSGAQMPRWASRLYLEITDIWLERLNNISSDDVGAEGLIPGVMDFGQRYYQFHDDPDAEGLPHDVFAHLWESINGKGSWGENPYVWVIEFKVVACESA